MLRTRSLVVIGGVLSTAPLMSQSQVRTFSALVPANTFGLSAASIGDVDGDLVPDFLFGESGDPTNGLAAGSASVRSGATGLVIHRVFGRAANEGLGTQVAGLGDTNGDGVPDFAVTVPGRASTAGGLSTRGVVQLHSGLDASVLHVLEPLNGLSVARSGMAGAGDVNGDGFADLIVGETTSANSAGSVTVFSGRDGSTLYEIPGLSTLARSGTAVCTTGDVNDDGFDDFAVASPGPFGQVDVYSGFDGSTLYSIDASTTGGRPGNSVANVGDLDDDGVDDLVLDTSTPIFGPPGIAAVSGVDGSLLWTEPRSGDPSGAGDVDGDGTPDILLGSPFTSIFPSSGVVTILSGRTRAVLRTFTSPVAGRPFADNSGSAGDLTGDGLSEVWFTGPNLNGQPIVSVFDAGFVATPGIVMRRGAACLGSDNRLPAIDITAPPRIGSPVEFHLRSATPQRLLALHLGLPTNIDLALFGAVGCSSLASPLVALGGGSDASGRAKISVAVPAVTSLIGARIATQWTLIDTGANPLTIVETQALDLTIGG